LLAFLDVPFVFGPVGRGETTPRALRGTFPTRGYVSDLARGAANWAVRIDPLMAAVFRRSSAMLCKTKETLHSIPARYQEKCVVQVDVGTDAPAWPAVRRRPPGQGGFRVLYVGRLVYWKGLHLGLMAFAIFRCAHPDARLTVIGNGPDEAWLRRIARLLGIGDAITWVPWLEQAVVMREYPLHDAFLFPSLHDSSGNAVLEALSQGLPVVCLDAGGPAVLVDSSCGIQVRPGEPDALVQDLADALCELAEDPVRLRSMGEAAVRRARDNFSWERQAARMAGLYRSLCAARHPRNGAVTEVTA
jgi:glycosyltransferase involved in cell wall biosynthesis